MIRASSHPSRHILPTAAAQGQFFAYRGFRLSARELLNKLMRERCDTAEPAQEVQSRTIACQNSRNSPVKAEDILLFADKLAIFQAPFQF